jgi:hypothetical protein
MAPPLTGLLMTATRPNFIALIIAAYWDLDRVFRALWAPALMAFALFVAAQFSSLLLAGVFARTFIAKMVIAQAIELGALVLIAPFLIAVHRFILVGETARIHEIASAGPRVGRFAFWLVLLGLVASLPFMFTIFTLETAPVYYTAQAPRPPAATGIARELVTFALSVAAFVAVTRLMILLPAAAVEAPGADPSNAFADTRGNTGYIAFGTFLCVLPLLCLWLLAALTLPQILPWQAAGLASYFTLKVMLFIALALGAGIASRVYLALGDRLNRPAAA